MRTKKDGTHDKRFREYCIRGHLRTPENKRRNRGCRLCERLLEEQRRRKQGVKQALIKSENRCIHGHDLTKLNALIFVRNRSICRECRTITAKKSRMKYIEKRRSHSAKYMKNRSNALPDAFIANTFFKTSISAVPEEIIDFKRTILLTKRKLKIHNMGGV